MRSTERSRIHPLEMITNRRATLGAMAGAALSTIGARRYTAAQTPEASPDEPQVAIRRDASTLSVEERSAYVNAILALKIKPSPWIEGLSVYDTFVDWHRDAFVCGVSAAHMGPAFLPWHRVYLHLFQQQISEVDPSVTIPYWNWAVDNTPDSYVWQDDFMGGNGDKSNGEAVVTGPFQKDKWTIDVFDYGDTRQFPYIIRDLGAGNLAPSLPTQDDVEAALAIATYDSAPWNATTPAANSFRNFLEGWRDCAEQMCDPLAGIGTTCTGGHELHNRVHLWVSGEFAFAHEMRMEGSATPEASTPTASDEIFGTMAANSSPNDPVFFLHHANIDRIWNLWLQRHGPVYAPESGGPFGHNLNDFMWPYQDIGLQVSPAMMFDSASWGYVYDTDL